MKKHLGVIFTSPFRLLSGALVKQLHEPIRTEPLATDWTAIFGLIK